MTRAVLMLSLCAAMLGGLLVATGCATTECPRQCAQDCEPDRPVILGRTVGNCHTDTECLGVARELCAQGERYWCDVAREHY